MSELIVKEMCPGCGNARGNNTCRVIKDPGWIYQHRGNCFARMTPERVREIEYEIHHREKGK